MKQRQSLPSNAAVCFLDSFPCSAILAPFCRLLAFRFLACSSRLPIRPTLFPARVEKKSRVQPKEEVGPQICRKRERTAFFAISSASFFLAFFFVLRMVAVLFIFLVLAVVLLFLVLPALQAAANAASRTQPEATVPQPKPAIPPNPPAVKKGGFRLPIRNRSPLTVASIINSFTEVTIEPDR